METNVEVTEVTSSRETDTGLATNSSIESGDVDTEVNDNTLTNEPSPRHDDDVRNDNEESNDGLRARVHENGKNAAEEKRGEGITANSSRGTNVPQTPIAYTIEFDNNKEVDTAKYHNLFERYNARHRRNLSMSKVEIKSKKPSAILSPNLGQKQKVPSTHSEGYFSSEDETKRKTDQLSERLKQLGMKNPSRADSSTKTFANENVDHQNKYLKTRSNDGEIRRNIWSQSLSLEFESNENEYWTSQRSATINDLSRVQISNYDDDENEKQYTKNIEYIAHESEEANDFEDNKVSNMNYLTDDFNIRNTNEKESALSSINYAMNLDADDLADTNLDVFNVSNVDAASDGAVSETGTYTIHKDYTDEEKARMDIDKVFSVGVLTEDESNEAYVHNFKMSISRDNNTWISEWATQVAEHNSLPPIIGGTTGRTPPLSPTKIPSPIHTRSQRGLRNRYEHSDSNVSTDTYVRIKERINLVSNQHQIIDSGGESDDDTSNSYNTPPNSSQRTPVHSTVGRRGSLSDSLFRRANSNENRRSVRKYLSSTKSKTADTNVELSNSPSQVMTTLRLERRSNSLDRKEYASDTTESNTSRKNSMKYKESDFKHTNSPVLSRLRPPIPKLTNSPILSRKVAATKVLNSPILERSKLLTKSSETKNIGYFTCVENSPYMLRKSNSTTNYHERTSYFDKDISIKAPNMLQNSPEFQRHLNIQRSSSNASIRNMRSQNFVSRRSSFNSNDIDRISSRGKFAVASDSSSEAGEQQRKSPLTPISSGIKLNRAFSIRRARLNCESDTTPNTTPEERRRRAQSEVKTATLANKQNYHRSRTNSVGAHNKESSKKAELTKFKTPSISRTDTGRFSMRAPKPNHSSNSQKTNQKSSKDHKKSGRSNSTLTSKEVEFQNWKRRKSYDPMKAAAEGRKKLMDNTKKHHSTEDSTGNHDNSVLRSASFHGTGGALSLANDWSDNELDYHYEDNQVPPPSSPQLEESDSDLETSSYLQTTQNVVSAMSARMTGYRPPLDSDNESDEDTSRSLRQNILKGMRHPSDTESSDERHAMAQSPISSTKYNKEFSLRNRIKLDLQRTKPVSSNVNRAKNLSHDTRSKSEFFSNVTRMESGRPGARISRALSMVPKNKSKEAKKPPMPNVREVEMQNWKRRKSYDPMKAAMEGRRKAGLAKKTINTNLSPSHVARSQSFHGSVGLAVSDWSDEEPVISADETSLY